MQLFCSTSEDEIKNKKIENSLATVKVFGHILDWHSTANSIKTLQSEITQIKFEKW